MSLTDKALPVVADSRLSRLRAPRRKSSQDSPPPFAFCDEEEDSIFPLCVNLLHHSSVHWLLTLQNDPALVFRSIHLLRSGILQASDYSICKHGCTYSPHCQTPVPSVLLCKKSSHRLIQGGFFDCSALKMTKCQTHWKIWHLELFWWDLQCNLTLSHFLGRNSQKNHPVFWG